MSRRRIGWLVVGLVVGVCVVSACTDYAETSSGGSSASSSSGSIVVDAAPESSDGSDAAAAFDATPDGATDASSDADAGGTPCERFCRGEMFTCTGTNKQYADEVACLSACSTWQLGTADETTGNTLACRVYHLGIASQSEANATVHCAHTSASGGGVCSD